MEGICVEELYAHKLLVLSKMAISFNHKGVYQNTHGPFSPLPAEELPHFRVELPSHNQPHPPRVLPEASIHDPLRDHNIVQTIPA